MGVYIKGMTAQQARMWLNYHMPFTFVVTNDDIIEIPEPHGDLIDVKPFIEDYKNCEKHNCIDCMAAISRISCKAFIDKLNDAPIVIEAEGEQ